MEEIQNEVVQNETVKVVERKSKKSEEMQNRILESLRQSPKSEIQLVIEYGMPKDSASLNPTLRKLVDKGILKREKVKQEKKSSFVYTIVE